MDMHIRTSSAWNGDGPVLAKPSVNLVRLRDAPMYLRSPTGWEQPKLPRNYIRLGFSDDSEPKPPVSSTVINQLTNLAFFARYPRLQGKTIKGNRALESEWTRIKNQLLKPSSSVSSARWVIDLALPSTDPKPDYSRTEAELGVWEAATINGRLPFKFATEETVMPDRKPGSYLSMLSLQFDGPRLAVYIAKHLYENASDSAKSREDRNAWRQILQLVQQHAYVHLRLFRAAAASMQNTLQELFNRFLPLPTVGRPMAVPKKHLDAYVQSLGQFITAMVQLELWEKTCEWEKTDYPELSRKISRAGVLFLPQGLKVKCAARPDVPDLPVPPAPIRPK